MCSESPCPLTLSPRQPANSTFNLPALFTASRFDKNSNQIADVVAISHFCLFFCHHFIRQSKKKIFPPNFRSSWYPPPCVQLSITDSVRHLIILIVIFNKPDQTTDLSVENILKMTNCTDAFWRTKW